MSCLFCDSYFHVSHFCDKYVTIQSRHDRATSKNCCPNCFLKSESWCKKCGYSKNCYVCFSTYHETVFCPNVIKVPRFFCPRIDEDLLLRFYDLLNVAEKWSLISTSPNLSNSVNLKPIRVIRKQFLGFPNHENYSNFDVMTIEQISFSYVPREYDFTYVKNNRVLPLKLPDVLYINFIEFEHSKLSSQELLQLLSPKTFVFRCTSTEFSPILNFSEILRKAPFLADIYLLSTNIQLTDSWLDDTQNLKKSNHFNFFSTFQEFNVNIKSLVSLIKKSTKSSVISLDFLLRWDETLNNKIKEARNEISKYFLPSECENPYCLKIQLNDFRNEGTYQDPEYYILKEDGVLGNEE